MENTHINYINERTAGTGKWFLSKPEFKEWVTSKGKAIYCEGLPGTGKTIIASLVIEELKRGTFSDGQKFGLAYFYCSLSRSAASETYVFLACLLKQLITQTEDLPDCVRNLYENQSADVDSLKEALVVILQGFPMSFIVVDALDEWEQEVRYRMPIIEELFDLRKRAKVNIFLTSRNIQYITDNLSNWSESQLVEISATETDMSLFLQMELSASKLLCASITRLNDLGNKCIDCVVKHSKGMSVTL
jgi:Cdc6-like AAA superfamily ATPase